MQIIFFYYFLAETSLKALKVEMIQNIEHLFILSKISLKL